MEYRLLAYYVGLTTHDYSMCEVFARGDDLHTATAAALLGKGMHQVTEDDRQVGKIFNFLTIYGGGPYKAASDLGVTVDDAKALQNQFYQAWPAVSVFKKRVERKLKNQGYIQTLWGRKLEPEKPHAGVNYLIQGCAADLCRAALVKVHRHLQDYESHLVNVVHDELILDIRMDELEDLVKVVPDLMNHQPINEVVPIEVDIGISKTTWAEKEDLTEQWLSDNLGSPVGRVPAETDRRVASLEAT